MKPFVFVYGPPGVGKSTCSRLLAEVYAMPFLDLDVQIEAVCGMSIPEIFSQQGEDSFRRLESEALQQALKGETTVIALGGGALVDIANHKLAEDHGLIVCLQAPVDTLRSRLAADDNQRPLLRNDNLEALLASRQAHYASFSHKVDTENLSPEQIVHEMQIALGRFRIRGMGQEYEVRVEEGGIRQLGSLLEQLGLKPPLAVVSESNVAPHHTAGVVQALKKAGLEAAEIVFPAGESNKTIGMVNQVWEQLIAARMERRGTVIALGGGVANDLVGFAAATYMRGVRWVTLPTSLLAMVDASLGGKTGVNLPAGKNLVGAFNPPQLVLVDPATLSTLPQVETTSGMAEVVKHGVISDPKLFELCAQGMEAIQQQWQPLISRGMAVKVQIIQEDPYEMGIREALNLGHTVGHAVEVLSGYKVRHGEGVAIGTVTETRLAQAIGLAPDGLADQISDVLAGVGLPTQIPAEMPRDVILERMQVDKKRKGGSLRFALPAAIGDVRTGVEIDNLSQLMAEL